MWKHYNFVKSLPDFTIIEGIKRSNNPRTDIIFQKVNNRLYVLETKYSYSGEWEGDRKPVTIDEFEKTDYYWDYEHGLQHGDEFEEMIDHGIYQGEDNESI